MKSIKHLAALVPVLGLALIANAQSGTGGQGTGGQGTGQTGKTGQGQTGGSGQTGTGGTGTTGTGQTGTTGQTGKTGQTPGDPSMTGKAGMTGMRLHSINDVIGMKVTSQTGEDLGKLEDVIVHSRGEIAYAVLSLTGENDKYYAIPWSVMQMHATAVGAGTAADSRTIVLPVSKDRLKTAPSFSKSAFPNITSPEWSREVDTFFASERRSTTGRPVEAGARMAGQPAWRASDLRGANVETTTGEKLGDIKEVAMDPMGRVSFVVLSVGGFLGMGDRQVAVPFEALKPKMDAGSATDKDAKIDTFTLATTKERLKEAPEFKGGRENWSQMTDPMYVNKVYEYYSVRPYWSDMGGDTGATGGTPRGTGGATGGTGGTTGGSTGGTGTGGSKGGTEKPDKP